MPVYSPTQSVKWFLPLHFDLILSLYMPLHQPGVRGYCLLLEDRKVKHLTI